MANPLKGEASFVSAGETFTLVIDINALCEAEAESGMKTGPLLEALDNGIDMTALRAMIWAGLQRKHSCNLLRAGEIMQAAGTGEVARALRAGLASAFPPPEKGKKADPRKATDATGSNG